MELKNIFKLIKTNRKGLLLWGLIGLLLGFILFNVYPNKYAVLGSFYVTRLVETPTNEFFAYEGYYAQQTAVTQTLNVVTMLESVEVLKSALEKINMPTNEKSLAHYKRLITVKKAGPQIVSLGVRSDTPSNAESLWYALSEALAETNSKINKQGDLHISINQVTDAPVLTLAYRQPHIYLLATMTITLTIKVLIISLKEYLK